MATGSLPSGYAPRLGECSPLHRAVRDSVETFLADARERSEHGFGVPRFVEEELRGFLRCGVLAYGFARVRWYAAGEPRLDASCGDCQRGRGRRGRVSGPLPRGRRAAHRGYRDLAGGRGPAGVGERDADPTGRRQRSRRSGAPAWRGR